MTERQSIKKLLSENAELRQQLDEAKETLRAITSGEVDALVINSKIGEQVFTLEGADTVYRVAIENINEGAITLSPEGTILYSNHYFARMMRIDLNKVIGTSIFDFVGTENHDPFTALLAQDSGRVEISLRAADGTQVPAYVATKKLQLDSLTICAIVTDLTQQKKSEEVRVLKDRLTEAQRLSHTGSWEWNIKSGEVRWSDEMYAVFGVEMNDFVPDIDSFTHFIHVDDLSTVTKIMKKLTEEGGSGGVDFHVVRPDGAVRFFHAEGRIAAFDEVGKPLLMIGTDQDITEQRKAEEKLRESEERYRRIIETANEGIMVADTSGAITFTNTKMAEMLGYTVQELVGKPGVSLVDPEEASSAFDKIEKRRFGLKEHYEIKFRRKDGSYLWTLVSGTPINDSEGRHIGNLGMYADITERKQTEQELKQRTIDLENTNKELESFSYSVSHDLKAPLRALDGFSEAVLMEYEDKLDAQGKDYLNRIRIASQTMSQLIEDMLGLSRITRSEMHLDNFDISAIAKSIAAEIKATQPERQVEFIIQPELTAYGDMRLVGIALRNLLENSWKFTAKYPKARIEFGANKKDGNLVYYVKDNGVGFDMKYSDKLFQPFRRLHSEKEFSGMGIGLATVLRIVRRHGGHIWAEAETGKGATFYFTLGGKEP